MGIKNVMKDIVVESSLFCLCINVLGNSLIILERLEVRRILGFLGLFCFNN